MWFWNITKIPADPLFQAWQEAKKDTHKNSVNGVVWVARNDGIPYVLESVKKAIDVIKRDDFEYLPISWDTNYLSFAKQLIVQSPNNFSSIGTPGWTGALYAGFQFIKSLQEEDDSHFEIIVPEVVWGNTHEIMKTVGFCNSDIKKSSDYSKNDNTFDTSYVDNYMEQERITPVFLFHATCKNPNGVDPTKEQWEELASKIEKKWGIAFFDIAYQWFWWTLDEDSLGIKIFEEADIPMIIAQSFSKNFSLYQHRTWALHVWGGSSHNPDIQSTLNNIARTTWSNPPAFWEQIVSTILGNTELKNQWENELMLLRESIIEKRSRLSDVIPGILDRKWMFDNLTLWNNNPKVLLQHLKKHHIYTAPDGRINLAGISDQNIDYIIETMKWKI